MKCPAELEKIYEEEPKDFVGYYDIDFYAGYSCGDGRASFVPVFDADRYVQSGGYDIYVSEYDDCSWDMLGALVNECWLKLERDAETGAISFRELIDFDVLVGEHHVSQQVLDNRNEWLEQNTVKLILDFIDAQCRDELGKSLEELLTQPCEDHPSLKEKIDNARAEDVILLWEISEIYKNGPAHVRNGFNYKLVIEKLANFEDIEAMYQQFLIELERSYGTPRQKHVVHFRLAFDWLDRLSMKGELKAKLLRPAFDTFCEKYHINYMGDNQAFMENMQSKFKVMRYFAEYFYFRYKNEESDSLEKKTYGELAFKTAALLAEKPRREDDVVWLEMCYHEGIGTEIISK